MPPKPPELTEYEKALLEQTCENDDCYNERAHGYILCLECLHGSSPPPDPDVVKAKKKWEDLKAWSVRWGVTVERGEEIEIRET